MASLSAAQVKEMFLSVAGVIIASKELLCEADRNIGDGDHGIGMALGFEAAQKELESKDFTDAYAVFGTVGRTMIKVMGGASGIIFGLLFFAGAKNMPPKPALTTADVAEIFAKALDEIRLKGQASVGDKTIVDGLHPMVEAMRLSASRQQDFKQFFHQAYLAAEEGKEKSKAYIARFGKAKTLGERAVGYPDAGCVTLTVLLKAMSEWANAHLPD